jgi:hypothetical protein
MSGAKVPLNEEEDALVRDTMEVLAKTEERACEAARADDPVMQQKEEARARRLMAALQCFGRLRYT